MLPYFAGERTPIKDPDARGVVAGLTLSHGAGDLYRAALEATASACATTSRPCARPVRRVERVVAVGGGAQGDLWTQIVVGRHRAAPGDPDPDHRRELRRGVPRRTARRRRCSTSTSGTRRSRSAEPDPRPARGLRRALRPVPRALHVHDRDGACPRGPREAHDTNHDRGAPLTYTLPQPRAAVAAAARRPPTWSPAATPACGRTSPAGRPRRAGGDHHGGARAQRLVGPRARPRPRRRRARLHLQPARGHRGVQERSRRRPRSSSRGRSGSTPTTCSPGLRTHRGPILTVANFAGRLAGTRRPAQPQRRPDEDGPGLLDDLERSTSPTTGSATGIAAWVATGAHRARRRVARPPAARAARHRRDRARPGAGRRAARGEGHHRRLRRGLHGHVQRDHRRRTAQPDRHLQGAAVAERAVGRDAARRRRRGGRGRRVARPSRA